MKAGKWDAYPVLAVFLLIIFAICKAAGRV